MIMQTSAQFIWTAMLKTPPIEIVKKTKEKIVKKLVTYSSPEFEPVPDKYCWLCGGETNGLGLLKKRKITDMFSDKCRARFPLSESLCTGCGGLLSNSSMRLYSVFATQERLWHPTRREWREILLSPPLSPWVGCLSTSGQKHLFYKAPINVCAKNCVVALEDFRISYRVEKLKEILGVIEPLLAIFNKEEIKTGRYRQDRIRNYGLRAWQEAENFIQTIRGNAVLELTLYVAVRKEQEAKEEEK